MVAKNLGRYLAPVALIAVAIAVALVVRGHVVSHHPVVALPVHHLPVSRDVARKRTFYVIKAGDSLSTISVKTRVPIATLEALNPSVDPTALQTGQRLRLRR